MALQQDSIVSSTGGEAVADSVVKHTTLTPSMVLSWLPRDATPSQQDSAIQAHFKPSEIRWSTRPDTLHLPGHDKGHNLLDIQLPQYYREGFFSGDSLFHPELPGGRFGVAGDPVPYSVHSDNVITSLLLASFIFAVVAFSHTRSFIGRQLKNFFYAPREGTTEVTETASEVRFQLFLILVNCLLLSLLFYFYTLNHISTTFVLQSPYQLLGIFLLLTMGYMVVKGLLYLWVNVTFFESKRNEQWLKAYVFLHSMEAILMYPLVVLQAYFDLADGKVLVYFLFVLIFVKLLTIYKSYVIFFRKNVVKFQIILYFCALEIVPIISFWGVLVMTANSLKINF